jgi:hypothetical protein
MIDTHDFCICSAAIGDQKYKRLMPLMKQSLIDNGYKGHFMLADKEPDGCPPHPNPNHKYVDGSGCVPYAFKPFLMDQARVKGYRYIAWVDSVIRLQQPFSVVAKIVAERGYFFGHNNPRLGNYTSDDCLSYFDMDRESIMDTPCIHGGLMFLDMENEKAAKFLKKTKELAFSGGPYCADWRNDSGQVSKDPRVKGHRPQQSVAVILTLKLGMTRYVDNSLTYSDDDKCIFKMMR